MPRLRSRGLHPARVVVVGFAGAVAVSTALLMLPVATESGQGSPFRVALFTAVSATCVTGLTVVDTPTHWSTFGELVILGSIQAGGFGIMTLASILGLLMSRRMGLRTRLLAQAETKAMSLGDMRRVLRGVALTSLLIEAAVALLLTVRFVVGYDERPGRAAYLGIFHAISAFNNAGFGLRSDNLVGFVTDPWICLPIAVAVILGGLGFPVLFELRRELRTPQTWSIHTKLTVATTLVLLGLGTVLVLGFEWSNPKTLGPLDGPGRLLAAFFQGVMPRTAGFNSLDYAAMNEETWLVTDVLMFIGGGSASTAGGIKVTALAVLVLAVRAEVRSHDQVDAFERAVPAGAVRLAIAVTLLASAIVTVGTLALLSLSDLNLDQALFEATSAFATVGLTTGITAGLAPSAHYVLTALMFIGRTGTITFATALALREGGRLYQLPEERPIVG